jgi:hypothetical protein
VLRAGAGAGAQIQASKEKRGKRGKKREKREIRN